MLQFKIWISTGNAFLIFYIFKTFENIFMGFKPNDFVLNTILHWHSRMSYLPLSPSQYLDPLNLLICFDNFNQDFVYLYTEFEKLILLYYLLLYARLQVELNYLKSNFRLSSAERFCRKYKKSLLKFELTGNRMH